MLWIANIHSRDTFRLKADPSEQKHLKLLSCKGSERKDVWELIGRCDKASKALTIVLKTVYIEEGWGWPTYVASMLAIIQTFNV